MKQIRKFALAALTAGAMVMAPLTASALNIQLGFILDRSGSISEPEWATITSGLSAALGLVPLAGVDTYEVSVVTFANTATTVVDRVVFDNAVTRTAVSATVAGLSTPGNDTGGATNYFRAFNRMTNTLDIANANVDFSYVNFATDGRPTNPGNNNNANIQGIAAKTNLINSGVDNLSIEGIGLGATAAANLQNNYCHPGPCTIAPAPFAFPAQGFYIGVANADEYAAAIQGKVRTVTGQPAVPEPSTVILFGTGLAGLAAWRMRKAKQAA